MVGASPETFLNIFLYRSSSNPVTQVQRRKLKFREDQ